MRILLVLVRIFLKIWLSQSIINVEIVSNAFLGLLIKVTNFTSDWEAALLPEIAYLDESVEDFLKIWPSPPPN